MAARWAAVTFRETEKHHCRITGYEYPRMLKAHPMTRMAPAPRCRRQDNVSLSPPPFNYRRDTLSAGTLESTRSRTVRNSTARMPTVRLSDNRSGLDVERRKQRGGTVPSVVARAPFVLLGLHLQQRGARSRASIWGDFSSTHSTHGVFGRIDIQPDDVPDFVDQLRVSSLWQKSTILARPDRSRFVHLTAMAMGKRPAARQASPMWVDTADLPTSDGHPFFERLNRVLEEAGFDAFVEGLCAAFYAARMGRPSLRPGRYFRLLVIGYFEGLSSERGIAWRVADSLSLRSFLDLDVTEAAPDHSTLSRTRRRIDVETHVSVFTWVLERLADAGLVRGKTVGIDATTLEANAAMRSIERRDTGESYEAFVRSLAEASGVETPTRADLARFDRSRKNKKTSNKEWKSPQDPDAKIAKMKDGRTHMAHKAEHGVDMDTGAIVSVTVQDASDGDTATLPETLIMAAEQVELVQPDGPGVEEVVADKGYHSDETLVALGAVGVRSHVSEPERGRRCWQDKKTGETPPEKRAAQKALYANRRRVRGRRGRRLQRCRGEVVERTFAHLYETGGMRRVWVRGHENVRKRVLIQAAACNIGLLLRRLTGVGTPRSLQGRALSAICRLIGRLIDRWGRLTRAWGFKWTPTALVGSIAHRQAA